MACQWIVWIKGYFGQGKMKKTDSVCSSFSLKKLFYERKQTYSLKAESVQGASA